MTDYTIPRANAPIAGQEAPTIQWYNYLRGIGSSSTASNTALLADITIISDKLGSPDGTPENIPTLSNITDIQGIGSVFVTGANIKQVSLVNDAQVASPISLYGTNSSGAKGWHLVADAFSNSANISKTVTAGIVSFDLTDLADSGTGTLLATTFDAKGRKTGSRSATITGTSGRITVANGNASAGLPTIDLATVADAGGGALLRFVRDAWGRLSGTSAATTSDLTEGSNLYFTTGRVLATLLAGLSTATSAVITAADSVLIAFGKLQAQITGHVSNTSNPHSVTKAQVGLANADNTSDVNKPVSTAQAAADALNVPLDGTRTMTGTLNIQAPTSLQLLMGASHSTIATGPIVSGAADGNLVNENISCSATVAFGPRHNFYRGRGTCASPSTVQANDTLGAINMISRVGSAWKNSAWVLAEVDGTPGATFAPGRISLGTSDGITAAASRWGVLAGGSFIPFADNTYDIGSASFRGRVAYFATGAINTSDAREKTVVTPLTDVELAAAADLARAPGTYQWLSAVQAKGADARKHAGLTVQRAIEIMQSHGLDPFAYGFICYDQWDETPEIVNSWPAQDAVLDDDGNVITPAIEAGSEITQAYRPAGDRYSFRTDELLLFMARGFAARLDALESA